MLRLRGVSGSRVISWMPLTTMDANMITAAPPKTDCGMMDTTAPNFGHRPHRIRKTAPQAKALRFTILVMVTRPTFWLNDVFGNTPKRAAKLEPMPSQTTPPESSLSVASRSMPPCVTPEMSPTVSTAVTMNITSTGAMARMSNTGATGSGFGMANHAAAATLSQFKTHALVYSTPSELMPVVGSTSPMMPATT